MSSAFELVTVKDDRTRCCCGSEAGFTDGAVYGFKNKHKKIQVMVGNISSPEL